VQRKAVTLPGALSCGVTCSDATLDAARPRRQDEVTLARRIIEALDWRAAVEALEGR
jgi:hypothetical protein